LPSGTLRIGSVACRQRSGSSARPGRCGRDLSALDAVAPRHAVGGPGTSARLGLGQGPTAARSASRVRSERPGQAGRCGGRTRPRGNRGPGPTSGTDPGRVRARGEARSRARSPRWSSWPRRCRRRPAGTRSRRFVPATFRVYDARQAPKSGAFVRAGIRSPAPAERRRRRLRRSRNRDLA